MCSDDGHARFLGGGAAAMRPRYPAAWSWRTPGSITRSCATFRARLVEGGAADRMFGVMLQRLTEAGLLKSGGWQRTDAT